MFRYRGGSNERVFDFGKEGAASMRVSPGLSSYAEDPEGAGMSVGELVEFGKGKVPRERWGDTEIRLMATAGMRLLGPEAQGRILEACRRALRRSGFKFRDDWASVITGSAAPFLFFFLSFKACSISIWSMHENFLPPGAVSTFRFLRLMFISGSCIIFQ